MSKEKDLHFFAPDLPFLQRRCTTEEAYRRFFPQKKGATLIGETSVFTLYSKEAPLAIRRQNRASKIVVSLRHPATFAQSLHQFWLLREIESEPSFEKAIAREHSERGCIPGFSQNQECTYTYFAQYASHLLPYVNTFGRENLFVLIYEEFAASPEQIFRQLLHFLSLPFSSSTVFFRANPSATPRSLHLLRLLQHPPRILRTLARPLPLPLRSQLSKKLLQLNLIERPLPPLSPQLLRTFVEPLKPELENLSKLLQRDCFGLWNIPA